MKSIPKSKAGKLELVKSLLSGEIKVKDLATGEKQWEVWRQDRFIDSNYFIGPEPERQRVTYDELRQIIDENENPFRNFIVLKYEARPDQHHDDDLTLDLSK